MTAHVPPMAPVVYLGVAMDRATGTSRDGHLIARELADTGVVVYRPSTTWTGGNHHPRMVEKINRQMLGECHAMVADLRGSVYTIGVPCEIESATARGVVAVVVTDPDTPKSVVLQANPRVVWADSNSEAVALASDYAHIRFKQHRTPNTHLKVLLTGEALGDGGWDAEPEKAYSDDAGYDLEVSEDTTVPPRGFVDIPSTVAGIEPPAGTWGLVIGRSSTLRKRGLMVNQGVIDFGWRGPLFAGVFNMTDEPVHVKRGDRLAQYILIPVVPSELIPVARPEDLTYHPRGHNGFGSSGGHSA